MTWTQNYTPLFDSLIASTLVAAAPVVVLLGLLAFFHVRAHFAALAGLATVALTRRRACLSHAGITGAACRRLRRGYGLLPIGWIVLNVDVSSTTITSTPGISKS